MKYVSFGTFNLHTLFYTIKFLLRNDLNPEIIEETNRFFRHLEEKYRLR